MALEIYMIGLFVQNMPESLAFYQHLGLPIPVDAADQQHVEIKLTGPLTFFFDSRSLPPDTAAREQGVQPLTVLFEFFLPSRAAVDSKYAELIRLGYQSYHAPFTGPNGMHFALINDPNNNTVLLSAE